MVDLETTEVITNVGYCMVESFFSFFYDWTQV